MNTLRTTGFAIVVAGFGMVATGTNAQAQSFRSIDTQALILMKQVETMHDEVHAHFRLTPYFAHLDRDVAQMERLARHIHEVAYRGGSIVHLRHDVEKLDAVYLTLKESLILCGEPGN